MQRDDQEVDREREHEDAEDEQVEEAVALADARSPPCAPSKARPPDQREPGVGDEVVEQEVARRRASEASRRGSSRRRSRAAGAPPRNTIASTSDEEAARDLDARRVSAAVDVADDREHEQHGRSRPRSQLASGPASRQRRPLRQARAARRKLRIGLGVRPGQTSRGPVMDVSVPRGSLENDHAYARDEGRLRRSGDAPHTEPARVTSGSARSSRASCGNPRMPPSNSCGPPPVDECPTDERSDYLMSRVMWTTVVPPSRRPRGGATVMQP